MVGELRRSGSSAKQFAEMHGVSVARVYQWCTRLRREERRLDSKSNAAPGLVEVKLPAGGARALASDSERIELELSSGRRLSVPVGMSLDRLSALVRMLERP